MLLLCSVQGSPIPTKVDKGRLSWVMSGQRADRNEQAGLLLGKGSSSLKPCLIPAKTVPFPLNTSAKYAGIFTCHIYFPNNVLMEKKIMQAVCSSYSFFWEEPWHKQWDCHHSVRNMEGPRCQILPLICTQTPPLIWTGNSGKPPKLVKMHAGIGIHRLCPGDVSWYSHVWSMYAHKNLNSMRISSTVHS